MMNLVSQNVRNSGKMVVNADLCICIGDKIHNVVKPILRIKRVVIGVGYCI